MLALACGPIQGVPLGDEPTVADATTTDGASSSTGAPECTLPTLDDLTLGNVHIDAGVVDDIARGTSQQLRLTALVDGYLTEVQACVTWSVEPTDAASISADGLLFVAASVPIGAQLLVTADIEDGRRILELPMMVYEPVATPLLGYWSETQRTSCTGEPFWPTNPVGELAFFDNGEFRVTWAPFELKFDYTGMFTHSPQDQGGSGALALTVTGGSFVPNDLDGVGLATVNSDGVLVLTDMFLGTADGETPVFSCGHYFE